MSKTIIPATDWFFLDESGDKLFLWPLAAWALNEAGQTIGLVAATEKASDGSAVLSPVAPVQGRYLHRLQLSSQEIKDFIKPLTDESDFPDLTEI